MSEQQPQQRVVVGVDGSEDGMRAVDYGVREAVAKGWDLLLVHAVDDAVLAGAWGVVYDPGMLQESGRDAAERAREHAIGMGMPPERVTAEVHMGNPGAVLTRMSEDVMTVVVGRRAMSGLERLFVGSTSVGVAATAHCPVIMVSAASHPGPTGGLGAIAVGVDATSRSDEALAYAFHEANRRDARLDVVHAFEVPTSFFADQRNRSERIEAQSTAAREGVAKLLEPMRARYPNVRVETSIANNHPVKELAARSSQVDLLVVGVHGVGLPGFSPGATDRALMAHCECPLALIRHARR